MIRQDKSNKFTTPFNATPHTVIRKAGNKITVESPTGAQYSRNTTFVRKYVEKEIEDKQDGKKAEDDGCSEDTNQQTVLEGSDRPVSITECHKDVTYAKPKRERKVPQKFTDFVIG